MENNELVKEINKNMAMVLPPGISTEELQTMLGEYVNQLIQKDFQKLIFILYRLDVSESKVKKSLQQNPAESTGKVIAALIIDRQLQKIKTRQQFKQKDDDLTGEEKW